MARTNPIHDRIQNHYDSNENNQNASNVNCSGTGNFWVIPEEYQIIKYVTIFGETKLKKAGGLPFGKFFWRKNIQIIDQRDQIINLPEITDFKTQNGVSVAVDLFVQYTITDVRKYIANQLNLNEKLAENIKAIMQQYFRNKNSSDVFQGNISIDEIGRDKFRNLESQYGICFTQFGATKLKLPEVDDDRTRRVETQLKMETERAAMQEKMETKRQELEMTKAQLTLERDIELYRAETDNMKRAEMLRNIQAALVKFPPEQQDSLLQEIYRIDKMVEGGANINYFNIPNGKSK